MAGYFSNMAGSIAGFSPTFASPNLKDPSGSYSSAYGAYANTASDMVKTGFDQLNQALFERQQQNQGIWQGYKNLNQRVQQKLAGSNEANLADLKEQYDARSGQMAQQMINRGLGNWSIQQSMQNQLGSDFAREKTRSNNSFAQLQADAMQRVMMGGLGAREHGADALTGIRGMGLNFLSSMTPVPPDFGTYFGAAQALGANHMPGPLPGMPGMSPPNGPIGGAQPAGLFTPGYDVGGGGGGGWGLADYAAAAGSRIPGVMPDSAYGAASGYAKDESGQLYPSYATSPQDSWAALAGGNYGRREATY